MEISDIRAEIDEIDDRITALFLRRMELAAEIAERKKELSVPVTDSQREKDILRRVYLRSGELSPYTLKLYECILSLSKQRQEAIISRSGVEDRP